MPNDAFSPVDDPEKVRQEAHNAATQIAKSLSDCFYKLDGLLTKVPESAPAKSELKAIRDNLFVQKNKAEQIVQQATTTATTDPTPVPPTAPAAPATATASSRIASIPSVAAETVFEGFRKGQEAEAGSLATDGKVVTFGGKPVMKNENGQISASWAGSPSMSIVASVNSLALLAGLGTKVFSMQDGEPHVNGQKVDPNEWVSLGKMDAPQAATASKRASGVPALLLKK